MSLTYMANDTVYCFWRHHVALQEHDPVKMNGRLVVYNANVLESLLRTKLYPPRLRTNLVSRSHLLNKLDANLLSADDYFLRKLTLVSAPAGFGKTTLVAQWLSESLSKYSPFAWFSLDESDGDPVRFLTYAIAALQNRVPNIGTDILEALLSSDRGVTTRSLEPLLTSLLNDMEAFARPIILLLDDYHMVESPTIDGMITFMVDHLPDNAHLVITSRTEPTLSLSRWRARGVLVEIHAGELRFTVQETAQFLNQFVGLGLSANDINTLEMRTEGWIAGLQLAAITMQGADDISGFVAVFKGSNRFVLDYLTDEVLNKQPTEIQNFLLPTSILDQLSGPLCDAVMGAVDRELGTGDRVTGIGGLPKMDRPGQEMLEYLEQANLFIQPLDNERNWYRYHRMFGELLQDRLRKTMPDMMPKFHLRAAHWYKENNMTAEAVKHMLAADAFEDVADLIELEARSFLMLGENMTVRRWIKALPPELVRSRPHLCLAQALALASVRDLNGIQTCLIDVETFLDSPRSATLPSMEVSRLAAEVAAFRALLAYWGNEDVTEAITLCKQALAGLPEDDLFLRGMITLILGIMYRTNDELEAASQTLIEAITVNQKAGNIMVALNAQAAFGGLLEAQGKLHQVENSLSRALRQATKPDGTRLPAASFALVGLGKLYRQWNELDKAADFLKQATDLARRYGLEDVMLDSQITLALIMGGQANWERASEAFDHAEQLAQKWGRVRPLERVSLFRAHLWLAQGNLAAATRWAKDSELNIEDPLSDWDEVAHLTLARVLIAQAKYDQALYLLQRLQKAAAQAGRTGSLLEIFALEALALDGQGDLDGSLGILAESLSLAEPEGYMRVYLDEGEPMSRLLHRAAKKGIAPLYVNKLLVAFGELGQPVSPTLLRPQTSDLLEPLSQRELEVLDLMALGLTNRQIAQRLYLSSNTVKRHTMNFYQKLGVHNRTEATAKARTLGILPLK